MYRSRLKQRIGQASRVLHRCERWLNNGGAFILTEQVGENNQRELSNSRNAQERDIGPGGFSVKNVRISLIARNESRSIVEALF